MMLKNDPLRILLFSVLLGGLSLFALQSNSSAHGSAYQAPPPDIPFFPKGPTASPTLAGPGGATPASPNAGQLQAASTVSSTDLSHWSYWWFFNKDGYLNTRPRLKKATISSGAEFQGEVIMRPADSIITDIILPALQEAIAEDRTGSISATSYIAMGRIGRPGTDAIFTSLVNGVRDRDPGTRESALLSLGIQGDVRAIPLLLGVLGNEKATRIELKTSFNTRASAFAGFGLAMIASRADNDDMRRMILLKLLSHLEDQGEAQEIRVAIVQALAKMQLPFSDPRRTLEVDPEGDKKNKTDNVNVRYRDQLLERLWVLMDEENDRVVLGHLPVAIAALAADAPAGIRANNISLLIQRFEEKPHKLELSGLVTALGRIGSAWGKPEDELVRAKLYGIAVEAKDAHARHLAFMALAEACNRSEAAPAPVMVSEELEAFLIERLGNGRNTDKPWVALAAGVHGARMRAAGSSVGAELSMQMRIVLNEGHSADEVSTAALACGLMEDERSGELLEKLLAKSGNSTVRGYASLALGLVGNTSAKVKLEVLLDKFRYQPQPLENVALGLGFMDRNSASELLRRRLSSATSDATASSIANAIGQLSDAAAAPELANLAKNSKLPASVRVAAAGALGLLAEGSDLPWRTSLARGINYRAKTATLFDDQGFGVLNFF